MGGPLADKIPQWIEPQPNQFGLGECAGDVGNGWFVSWLWFTNFVKKVSRVKNHSAEAKIEAKTIKLRRIAGKNRFRTCTKRGLLLVGLRRQSSATLD